MSKLLVRYYGLVREAQESAQTLDDYDLCSEDSISTAGWVAVCAADTAAQLALAKFIMENHGELVLQLQRP